MLLEITDSLVSKRFPIDSWPSHTPIWVSGNYLTSRVSGFEPTLFVSPTVCWTLGTQDARVPALEAVTGEGEAGVQLALSGQVVAAATSAFPSNDPQR